MNILDNWVGHPDTTITVMVGNPIVEVVELPDRDLLPYVAAQARADYGPDIDIELLWRANR
jgi:hypothetical protein